MPVTDQDANDITKGGGATAIVNVTTMPHIDALQTDEQGTDLPSLLGIVGALLARQTPEQLEEIWKDLFPSEVGPHIHVTAAAFMEALTAAVEGPHAAAAEEHPNSSAESEDV